VGEMREEGKEIKEMKKGKRQRRKQGRKERGNKTVMNLFSYLIQIYETVSELLDVSILPGAIVLL
jgi:hypothetical protein